MSERPLSSPAEPASVASDRVASDSVAPHQVAPHGHHATDDELRRAAGMLKAAGSPDRLRLLECLRGGEACVTGLAEHVGEAVTTTSNRLQLLAREGLVSRRREDRHQYYRLADAHVEQLLDMVLAHARHGPAGARAPLASQSATTTTAKP